MRLFGRRWCRATAVSGRRSRCRNAETRQKARRVQERQRGRVVQLERLKLKINQTQKVNQDSPTKKKS
jgi:hypothetical protein